MSQTEIDKYNPLSRIGGYVMGDQWSLVKDDVVELTKGTIGCVPVVGAFLSSCFAIVWNKFNTSENLTKVDFEKRMKILISDMEKKMNRKIDDEIVKFCSDNFESLCSAGFGFSEIEYIYDKQKKDSKPVSDAVKKYMTINHVCVLSFY
ncbi:hypothetical protein CYY_005810 [Polysphondylium violaceum]|uniref:Uncharacterized protein n=1 Tax=Polysphondylium violaceum TaxID=133409 RepID=A0A8J4URX9_9MYCE|nr:hypothetical protein CYY_005810 [Polysphondylium violaceum]